jgi:O-antigen/teichoic acid export membrane protein
MASNISDRATPLATAHTNLWVRRLWDGLRHVTSFRQKWLPRKRNAPLLYTGSSVLLSVAQMVSSIVLVRWILPQELGLWQSVYLALPYAYFLLCGINNGLSRDLPYYSGMADDATARSLASTAQFHTGVGSLITLIAGAGTCVFLTLRHHDVKLIFAVAAVTLLIIFNFYRNYFIVTFRSKSSFIALSWAQVLEASLMLASLPLVYYLRYTGMLLRLVIVSGLVVYFMCRFRPIKVASTWDWKSLRLLLTTGLPIFALDYLRNCSGTLPSLALLHIGGVLQVGYFALAVSACAAFEVIPNSVSQYVYPRMSYRYGRDKKAGALWGLCWKSSLVVVAVMLPLAIVGWFCLPPVIARLFPKYVAGTRAAQLMLFAAVCAGPAVCTNALWSIKAWKAMIAFQLTASALIAGAPFAGARMLASPLTGVAVGVVVARCLATAVGVALTYAATHPRSEALPGPLAPATFK